MPFTWEIEPSIYDLSIKGGKLKVVYGANEVKQRILVTLWHYWEEYFLNVPAGVPWYELILGSKDKKMVESLLRHAILNVPGVISIMRFQLQYPQALSRDFAIYADVEVTGGTISFFETTKPLTVNYLINELGVRLSNQIGVYLEVN